LESLGPDFSTVGQIGILDLLGHQTSMWLSNFHVAADLFSGQQKQIWVFSDDGIL
jgi:hypothetical protein